MARFFLKASALSLIILTLYVASGSFITGYLILYNQRVKVQKLAEHTPWDVIILGDSRALAMNWGTHAGVYNFALVHMGGLMGFDYMFSRYLKCHPPPRTLILSVIPETFCQGNETLIGPDAVRLLPFRELFKAVRPLTPAKMIRIGQIYLDLRNRLLPQWSGEIQKSLLNEQSGAMVLYASRASFVFKPKNYLTPSAQAGFHVSEDSRRQLLEILEHARDSRVKVILHFMPIPKSVFNYHEAFFRDVQAWVRVLKSQYPDVSSDPPYGPEDLWPDEFFLPDGMHLNARGAQRFEATRFPELLRLAGHAL